jgi:hypothetical protein
MDRKNLDPVYRTINDHKHYGHAVYHYGICSRNHYTKVERVTIVWSPCVKCSKKQSDLNQRNKFLKAKARRHKKEIPSFLKNELDVFMTDMEKRFKLLENRIDLEIRTDHKRDANTLQFELDELRAGIIPRPPPPPPSPSHSLVEPSFGFYE